ncbi:MAG: hypothetical protein JNK49_11305 [Planctomycetes bacterium]|nr:hypothetical protein [Planctomycetota bacterium]
MLWWQWLVYCSLPALAVTLLLVGAFGPRWFALAIAVAVLVPFALLEALPPWPWLLLQGTGSGEEWLPWVVAAAGLGGALHDLRVWPAALGGPPAVALLLAGPWLLLGRQRSQWSAEAATLHVGAVVGVLALVWLVQRLAARSGAALGVLLTMALCLGADGAALWLVGGQSGVAATTTAAVVGAVTLAVALWRRPFELGEGGWLALAVVHAGPLVVGHYQGLLPRWPALLLALMPVPLWCAAAPRAAHESSFGPPVRLAAAIVAAGGLAAAALMLLRR